MPNAKLAYEVLDLINANRAHFNMSTWVQCDGRALDPVSLAELTEQNKCGTAACFAGWTVAVSGHTMNEAEQIFDSAGRRVGFDISEFAKELLDIDDDQADGLFYVGDDEIDEAVATTFGPRP
jgi:hypothetical protein